MTTASERHQHLAVAGNAAKRTCLDLMSLIVTGTGFCRLKCSKDLPSVHLHPHCYSLSA